jgi:4-hydroxy-3-methylbut-2-en-1-yl diphosphate reductase
MREQGNQFQLGDVTVMLAEAYGFCWGVERAVQMAYEAKQAYPDRRLHITNEIIHNPGVNQVRLWPACLLLPHSLPYCL